MRSANIKKTGISKVNKAVKKIIKDIKQIAKNCPEAGRAEILDFLALEMDFENMKRKARNITTRINTAQEIFYVHEDSLDGGYIWDEDSSNAVFSGTEAECVLFCMENNEVSL